MDASAEEFFAAARRGELLIQRCDGCGHHQFAMPGLDPAIELCRNCCAPHPSWVPAAGSGSVVSFTATPGSRDAAGERGPSRIAGIVQLAEGPWIFAAIDCPQEETSVGMTVEVGFPAAEEEPAPVFRRAPPGD